MRRIHSRSDRPLRPFAGHPEAAHRRHADRAALGRDEAFAVPRLHGRPCRLRSGAGRDGRGGRCAIRVQTALEELDTEHNVARVRNADGSHLIHYHLLIAADGPYSKVAELIGLPRQKVVHSRQYAVPLLREMADTTIWLSGEYPGGYAWLFPRGAQANLGIGIDYDYARDAKHPLDKLHEQLAAAGNRRPDDTATHRRRDSRRRHARASRRGPGSVRRRRGRADPSDHRRRHRGGGDCRENMPAKRLPSGRRKASGAR